MKTRISIAGDIGSGKSTIARAVAARIGVEPLSTGGIQRQLAAARGINTLELNRLGRDRSLDRSADRRLSARFARRTARRRIAHGMAFRGRHLPNFPLYPARRRRRAHPRRLAQRRKLPPRGRGDRAAQGAQGERNPPISEILWCRYRRPAQLRSASSIRRMSASIGSSRRYSKREKSSGDAPERSRQSRRSRADARARCRRGRASGRAAKIFRRAAGFDPSVPIEVLYVDHTFFIAARTFAGSGRDSRRRRSCLLPHRRLRGRALCRRGERAPESSAARAAFPARRRLGICRAVSVIDTPSQRS